jgi:hypothetical protein
VLSSGPWWWNGLRGGQRVVGISLSTIKRYVKRRRAGEDLEPRRSTGRKRRILATPEEKRALWAQLEEHDEATLDLAGTQDEKDERADGGPRPPSCVPLLKMVCGSLPESGQDLASQPTISRMENKATIRSCHHIAQVLFDLYLRQREKDGAPERVLLDFDSTDDPTHGEQEGSYYHGYYGQHIYHPLLVFDGESGHLIRALLRAGNTHASNSCVAILKRIVRALRQRWPKVEIEKRADAGFAVPALYDYCEREGITYTIALITTHFPQVKCAS